MALVILTAAASDELERLEIVPYGRVLKVLERLEAWPAVSGAKPLRGNLVGHYRMRTGDYRVQFQVVGNTVTVERIGHRDGFYDEY
ncbi:MAG: type II toxin-antitoxin system RelE/ParE family toxin [Pirellulales bacterium]